MPDSQTSSSLFLSQKQVAATAQTTALSLSVSGLIGHLLGLGEAERKQQMANLMKEDATKRKIDQVANDNDLDRIKFDENSIPLGILGDEICLDGDVLKYYNEGQYSSFDLSSRIFRPVFYEDAVSNSKINGLLIVIASLSKSAFLSEKTKQNLIETLEEYVESLYVNNGSINFITSLLRTIGGGIYREKFGDYTYDELEDAYNDYKSGKIKKTGNWLDKLGNNLGYYLGSRNKDRDRYINISEKFDILKEQLENSFGEIRNNFDSFKNLCLQQVKSVDVFLERRKSEFLTRITKSKVLLQRLYNAYKENGNNFDVALSKLAGELYRSNELIKDRELISNEQNKGIKKIERRHIEHLTQNEVDEQVTRYFNFIPDTTRIIDREERSISIDPRLKIVEIQDQYYGSYYLDFNQLRNDINNSGGIMYYKIMLEKLKSKADSYAFMSNKKNAKVMQYIEDTIQKIENKSLKDDEREYIPNMLFHWISSLMNKPILQKDLQKKIITVTFMDGYDDGKNRDNFNVNNFQNISFDIYDPKTEKMQMGTIIKKGEKIYYKEDPGFAEFQIISAEELLTKLNFVKLNANDIEKEYIGDCWQMRKMIDFVKKLIEQERQKNVNASPKIETKANMDYQHASFANSIPENTLNTSRIFSKDNANEEPSSNNEENIHVDEEVGNKKSDISFQRPIGNLEKSYLETSIGG